MRIGIDASRAFVDQPTGTERYAFEIINRMMRLSEAGKHEWVVYVRPNFSPSMLNFEPGSNVKIQRIPLRYLWTQMGLAARTWTDGLDVLWVPAHTLPVFRRGFAGLGGGLRTVVTIHGIEYEWLPAYESRVQRWYLPLSTIYAVRHANKIIAVSEFTKKQLIERLRADAEKIETIYEGFDVLPQNKKINVSNNEEINILTTYNLRPREYLVTVGTIQPRKNLERLIEAFAKARLANNYKLVIVGKWGWKYAGVQAAPEKFGVGDRVVFSDYIDDQSRQALLNNALVYVQPSITEGFGLPVLEAMAAGVPVVSSSGGALAEVVGKAGIMFDPMKIEGISTAIASVVGNAKLRRELVEKGKKRVKEWRWETAAKKTLDLIVSN